MTGFWVAVGGVVGFALLVVWVLTIIDIVRRRLGAGKTAAWLIIVLLLPFLGSLLYWIMRKPSPEELEQQRLADEALRQSAASAPFDATGLRR